MARLRINAPDGKILRVEVPEGARPEQFDAITADILSDYEASKIETPGTVKSGALGFMSGIPGGQTVTSGITALGPKTYEEAHRGLETLKSKAWEEHPVAYGAGKTAGFVGTALTVPASIPGAVGIGIGAGLDVASKPEEFIADAVKGAAFGGAFGAAGKYVVGPAVKTVVNKLAPAIGKRSVAALGKPSVKDVETYLKNPEAIRKALTTPQMAEKLAGTVEDVGKASGQLGTMARSTLSPTKSPLNMRNMMEIFDEAQQKYLTEGLATSQADEIALKALNNQFTRLAKIAEQHGGEIPETTLQSIVRKLQAGVKENTWGNPDASAAQDAMKNLSGKLNALLKKSNIAFKEGMIPSAEAAALKGDIVGKFKLETAPFGKVSPTEATSTKMASILKEGKTESQDMLRRLQDLTGVNFLKLAETAKTKSAFTAGGSSQGINVIAHTAGYGVGALSNVPGGRLIGSLLGGVAGHNIDGGQVAKRILDAYLSGSARFSNSALVGVLAKYGPILVNAAKAGGNQLAATHFVLGTSDPEYQELEREVAGQ